MPISLLSGFSKILEKLMYKRLIDFINKHNILTDSQHGFRSERSTESAIFDLINSTIYAMDNKEKNIRNLS